MILSFVDAALPQETVPTFELLVEVEVVVISFSPNLVQLLVPDEILSINVE